MSPSRSRLRLLAALAVALLVAILAGCGGGSGSSERYRVAELPAGQVVRIGDSVITTKQLAAREDLMRRRATAQGQKVPKPGASGYPEFQRSAVADLVSQTIVKAELARCGAPCAVSASEISDQLAVARTEQFKGSQAAFLKALKAQGLTIGDARQLVRSQLEQSRLAEHATAEVTFSEAQARSYYDQHKDEFTQKAGREVSHILVKSRREADWVASHVTPADFAAYAKRYSTDPGSKLQGGRLGVISAGETVPAFEKAAFALGDGQISKPVKTQFGWHVILVKLVKERALGFAEVKEQLIASQLQDLRSKALGAYQKQLEQRYQPLTTYASRILAPVTEKPAATTSGTTP